MSTLALATAGGAFLWLKASTRAERKLQDLWHELEALRAEGVFDTDMVKDLPTPAQRYLLRVISPGTSLARSARLSMHGSIRLQPAAKAVPMEAEAIIAPPDGFVWKAKTRGGLMRIRGFDSFGHGQGSMRWWLFGLIPIVNAGGEDVSRSAAGRLASEAVLIPSRLLPQNGGRWQAVDDHTAYVRLNVGREQSVIRITVDDEGALQRVSLMRWRDNAVDGRPGYLRFDIDDFANERSFDGYTIPTSFRAGWKLGDPDEYSFFYATIDTAVFR